VLRATWIGPDGITIGCEVGEARTWECNALPDGVAAGVVILTGTDGVAAVTRQVSGTQVVVKPWGRAVRVAAAPDANEPASITALKPERSPIRTNVRRLDAVKDDGVEVIGVGGRLFWICGEEPDPDAYLVIDAPGLAAVQVAVSALRQGAADDVFEAPVQAGRVLHGVVTSGRDGDQPDSTIDLFETLPASAPPPPGPADTWPMVRRASTRSDADGRFVFEGLTSGPYVLTASHPTGGRASVTVASVGDPVVVRLSPPGRLTGRILRRGIPVVYARVRFVPRASALLASLDPHELRAGESATAEDGRFVLRLPPAREGDVQVLAPDGATLRIPVPPLRPGEERSIGDITLPDRRGLTVRLLEASACELSAVGPLGALGLSIVRGTRGANVHWFELPEPGDWAIFADCGGHESATRPAVVRIEASGPDVIVDARLATPPPVE
jgi:hypothetical protein